MPLFENMPYTNFQDLNLDHIVTKIGQFESSLNEYKTRLDTFEASLTGLESNYSALSAQVTAIRTQLDSVASDVASLNTTVAQHGTIIDSFQTTLTSIEERLTIIVGDITTLYANIDRVETQSVQRDNALGARVTLLESAVINPITVTEALQNHVPFGEDLRIASVNPTTEMPYGFAWSNGRPANVFTYTPHRGILIGDNYDDSNFLVVQTDCYQLDRNASYSVTIGIFPWFWDDTNEYGTFNPSKVLTCSGIRPEYGNYWNSMNGSSSMKVAIRPNGQLWIGYRGAIDSNLSGKYIGYIKLIEASSAETSVHLNREDGLYFKGIEAMISNAVPSSAEEHYNDDIETTWYPDWSGTGTESGVTATVNLWQNGKVGVGNISLFSPYEDDPIGNGEDNYVTVDISDLEIPKINNQGLVGQYVSVVTGEQYNVFLTNGTTYCDTMVITHSFPATITPQSNGHFATIPIHVSFQ